ncbi:hypothetical protein DSOUD_0717 [Desulfuromonas soudanensis]|uniref:Uncharacterized protein n=1 Tax=Desulfuromonas soudanensis TaxID=1603606 RepID=A0A0M4D7L3_9BACT|nr:hypothetical protein [Desulfuromonas soudanensis]ALC15505.1 hypothetical protein DSOUD_0717 [Desulfuromonas soudanensis]
MKRRDFFRDAFGETLRSAVKGFDGLRETFGDLNNSIQDAMNGTSMATGGFFDSYELSYSLTLAYPREMFEQMARDQGIVYEGVETIEIAKELSKRGVI